MRLFFVARDMPEGNQDLVVEAATPEQAFDLWGAYFYAQDWKPEDPAEFKDLTQLEGELHRFDPSKRVDIDDDLRIFEITPTGKPRAHMWHGDMPLVAYMEAAT